MKIRIAVGTVLGVAAAVLAALILFVSFSSLGAGTVLVEQPEHAKARVTVLMEAACAGEYDTVSSVIYGNPEMGVDKEPENAVSKLVWDAFQASFSYELVGGLYATDSGVAQNVRLTCMDIDSVTGNLRQYSQELLNQRVESAQDVSQIYDENNEYRESFVMDVLYDAAVMALEKDAKTVTREFTVDMLYHEGQWWARNDSDLMEAISGGIVN